jgi:DNA polymerase-3 subunit epsilon
VVDTLVVARRLHPGQRNSLDALCKRYGVDNSRRDLHGALLDARILVDVYLAMTGGQAAFTLDGDPATADVQQLAARRQRGAVQIPVIRANAQELAAHERALETIERASNGPALFRATDRRAGEG